MASYLWSGIGIFIAPITVTNAHSAPISLHWQVDSPIHTPNTTVVSPITLIITNTSHHEFPAAGWSLWLNSMSGVQDDPNDTQLSVNHVNGSLFVLRPNELKQNLRPGERWTLHLQQPDEHVSIDKLIQGPYLEWKSKNLLLPIQDLHVSFNYAIPLKSATESPLYQTNQSAGLATDGGILPTPSVMTLNRSIPALTVGLTTVSHSPLLVTIEQILKTAHAVNRRLPQRPVRLIENKQLKSESYRMIMQPATGVTIEASDDAGWFYGLQTLRLWLHAHADYSRGGVPLAAMTIEDQPRFAYRGLMIDVARNFETPTKIKQVIEWMALLKLNTLHLHLSDDEGFRVEIPGLPELTSKGACRAHQYACLPPAYGSGPFKSNRRGSGYYSVSAYKSILVFAKAHHVTVIPEIEMPGHAQAAIMALQANSEYRLEAFEASSNQAVEPMSSVQGYQHNAIDPLLPSSYRFIDKVVTELASMHAAAGVPLTRLHIGGDELAESAWSNLASESPQSMPIDRQNLWENFYDHVNATLATHHIKPMAWEDLGIVPLSKPYQINHHFLSEPVLLEIWNTSEGGEGLGHQLANAGFDVVMAPANHYYLDIVQSDSPMEHGHNWSGVTDLHKAWAYEPTESLPATPPLTQAGAHHIKGLEATLFSETLINDKRMEEMLFPRLLAVVERAWAQPPHWSQFSAEARANEQALDWQAFQMEAFQYVLPYIHSQYPTIAIDRR